MVCEFLKRFSKFLTIKDNGSEEPLWLAVHQVQSS
ncbi:hypothetical protein BN1222_03666 [Klebsiella quasipneumoniae]|nr:hypothetical protein BN1222_03666 [Klebsiella quasipneumoniae]